MSGNQDTSMKSVNSSLKAMIQRKGFVGWMGPHRLFLIFKASWSSDDLSVCGWTILGGTQLCTQSWHKAEKLHVWDPISTSSPPGAAGAVDEAQQLLVIKGIGGTTSHYHPGTQHASFSAALTLRCLPFYFLSLLHPRIHHEKLISLYWSSQARGKVKNKQLTCSHLYQGKNPIISGPSISKIM